MSGLHYTKSGKLDMRYSSSKSYTSRGGGRGFGSSFSSPSSSSYRSSSSTSNGLHFTKDGSLDMRYRSSKDATVPANSRSSNPLHYTKDGNLDMRFKSSKQGTSSGTSSSSQPVNLRKDATSNKSPSKQLSDMRNAMKNLCLDSKAVGIPLTKSGLPDMRTKAAREWVIVQATKSNGNIPDWIPRKKDGVVDNNKAVAQIFLETQTNNITYNENHRWEYYERKLKDNSSKFLEEVRSAHQMIVTLPQSDLLPNTEELKKKLKQTISPTQELAGKVSDVQNLIPDSIQALDQALLKPFLSNDCDVIGRGAFGIVYKGNLNGTDVAIKKLHLAQLTVREKNSFLKELKILAFLGEHPNLIKLHGYTLDPPCIVMEFIQLGSLSHLLYYCEDATIEARLSDGRVKKRIVVGMIHGMRQLHSVNIVHGDLKPQNILISADYSAKISDFGLATLRGKSSTAIESSMAHCDDVNPGGTAGYMAPELLDSSSAPELSSDVYSFGVLLNEILQEEEPFSSDYRRFHGRGPFAAVNFAKQGNRPAINRENGDKRIYELIRKCWDAKPELRPTFDVISQIFSQNVDFPNSFNF